MTFELAQDLSLWSTPAKNTVSKCLVNI